MPSNLCNKCHLKQSNPNGTFKNCQMIYNLDAPDCRAELQVYVNNNPCDFIRKEQVLRWNQQDKIALDYFVYSICEECCDCIKKGSTASMYDALAATHTTANPTLYTTKRGNCPAHAYYDVRQLFWVQYMKGVAICMRETKFFLFFKSRKTFPPNTY